MKKITVGRIVNFVMPDGSIRPAIVVRVWGSGDPGEDLVNVQVFTDSHNDGFEWGVEWRTSVRHDEIHNATGTWHWPKVEQLPTAIQLASTPE